MESTIVIFGAFSAIAFPFAMYFIGKSIYHMAKIVTNVTGEYAMFLGPLILFMPSQLNDEGNEHRVKFLRNSGGLLFSIVVTPVVPALLNR